MEFYQNKGIKILNIEGSEILKNNLEGRYIKKEYTAVLDYSMLSEELGSKLQINKKKVTQRVVALDFNYGFTKLDLDKIKVEIENIKNNDKLNNRLEYLNGLVEKNEGKDIKSLSIDETREYLYENGFALEYKDNKNGGTKTIEYVFWFRSSSKARTGKCLFIDKKLHKNIVKWQQMGLEIPVGQKGKIIEMASYMALTSSSICGHMTINPDEILVINDLESYTNKLCNNVYFDDSSKEVKIEKKEMRVKNTLFDGQALLDSSLFNEGINFVLLRHHFFKACAFKSHIQQFFKDYCKDNGEDYNTFTVKDRYGNNILVKNIKMITTENAMKWEKFKDLGASFELWKEKVKEDNNIFGICKYNHASKFGEYQRMSYQMLNSLPISMETVEKLAEYSIGEVNDYKNNNDKYIQFLEDNANCTNANKMMIDIFNTNSDFKNTKFYRDYKTELLKGAKKQLKFGKVKIIGDNLTVVGNPYAMLQHSVGLVPNIDNVVCDNYIDITLPVLDFGYSVYTKRFNKCKLSMFRNPHNSPNNVIYGVNKPSAILDKYFDLGVNVVAVNLVRTDLQDRANGLDQDSDFMFATNNKDIVEASKVCMSDYPTIVNNIKKDDKEYVNTPKNLAKIDNTLAKAKGDIGTTSNLAQVALSYYYDTNKKEYLVIADILSVLAQVSIDGAKRTFVCTVDTEVKRLGKMVDAKRPEFWRLINAKIKPDRLVNFNTAMDYLYNTVDKNVKKADGKESITKCREIVNNKNGKANEKQMKSILDKIKEFDNIVKANKDTSKLIKQSEGQKKAIAVKEELLWEELIEYVESLKINDKTMNRLILRALNEGSKDECKYYRRKLLNALYQGHKTKFLATFKK